MERHVPGMPRKLCRQTIAKFWALLEWGCPQSMPTELGLQTF